MTETWWTTWYGMGIWAILSVYKRGLHGFVAVLYDLILAEIIGVVHGLIVVNFGDDSAGIWMIHLIYTICVTS